ncbi:hypothetical protein H9N25_10345 [Pedobacter riviphilus]|uniref:Replication-associated protein G2P N-terminal domain-containing protein n=1 Tax=Pedobacter riviphilus TaxID=2766984 RepID=A0ABX6TMI8_9SPHI|nr:phage/plasmid replication protein [Pedobacter riviphilus]QNR86744.1 hypothetical protein H9N25_10345 [Pedobacter riviphilus]
MIDSLNLFLALDFANNKEQFNHILSLFNQKPDKLTSKITGEEFFSGNIKNFGIRINNNSLTINGSICKFYYGNNQKTLSYTDFVQAILELEELLGLDLEEAIVRRIDLAENLFMKFKPESYYPLLIKGGFLKRREDDNGLYFRNKNRTVLLYDKVVKEKKSQVLIDADFVNKNVLRYEFRMNRNMEISKRLNVKGAKLLDIINNYTLLVDYWRKSFDLIPKDIELNIPEDSFFHTASGFRDFLAVHGMKSLGGFGRIINMIQEAKARNVFKYPAQSSNLKTVVKTIASKTQSSKVPAMLLELEKRLDEAAIKAVEDFH